MKFFRVQKHAAQVVRGSERSTAPAMRASRCARFACATRREKGRRAEARGKRAIRAADLSSVSKGEIGWSRPAWHGDSEERETGTRAGSRPRPPGPILSAQLDTRNMQRFILIGRALVTTDRTEFHGSLRTRFSQAAISKYFHESHAPRWNRDNATEAWNTQRSDARYAKPSYGSRKDAYN